MINGTFFRSVRNHGPYFLLFMLILVPGLAFSQIEISSIEELQKIGKDAAFPLDGDYVLTQDIEASGTLNWNDGAGFDPIGIYKWDQPELSFSGTFDGQGYVISNLTINRPDKNDVGLFGCIRNESIIQNLGVAGGNITGDTRVGGLAGQNNDSTIFECYSTAEVTCSGRYVGGLVGYQEGTLTNSFARGDVSGSSWDIGGLAGKNYGVITNCYATGSVSGPIYGVGGLVGDTDLDGEVVSSFWDVETSGMSESDGGEGLTTGQMQTKSTFTDAGWDFDSVWYMLSGGSYPYLKSAPPAEDAILIPDLTGMAQADAEDTLTSAGLILGEVTEEYSETIPEGHVISQDPAAGLEVIAGALVDLVISLGPEPITYTVVFETDNTSGAYIDGVTTQTLGQGDDCSTVTAIAPEGYFFLKWNKDDEVFSKENPLTVEDVSEDMTITAIFRNIDEVMEKIRLYILGKSEDSTDTDINDNGFVDISDIIRLMTK